MLDVVVIFAVIMFAAFVVRLTMVADSPHGASGTVSSEPSDEGAKEI